MIMARLWLFRQTKVMKKVVLSLLALFSGAGVAFPFAGFTPLSGSGANGSYSLETAVSGYSVGDDGTVVGHGSVVPPGPSEAGVALTFDARHKAVRVYTVDGVLVYRSESGDFNPDSLPCGLYIVCRGNSVEKFLKTL